MGKDCDGGFVKDNLAVVVAKLAYSQEIVLERGHDLGVSVGKVELDVGLC